MANQPSTSVLSHPALEESAIVHDILEFIGPGAFRFMAPVNKRFREAYLTAFRENTTSYLTAVQSQDWFEICLQEMKVNGRGEGIRKIVELGDRYSLRGADELKQGHYKEALKLLQQAINVKERVIPVSEALAKTYLDLSNAHFKLNQHKAETKSLQETIAMYKRVNPVSYNIAVAHQRLGILQRDRGLYKASVASLKEAIRIYKLVMPVSRNLTASYGCLGDVQNERQCRYKEAVVSYGEAIRILQQLAPGSKALANRHFQRGLAQFRQGWFEASTGSFQEAVTIFKRQMPGSGALAEAHFQLGLAQFHQGWFEASVGSCQEAITIFKRQMPGSKGLAREADDLLRIARASFRRQQDWRKEQGSL